MRWFHGTSSTSAAGILSSGVDVDAPRVRDAGDLGWGFYLTSDLARARACGEVVLEVRVDPSRLGHLPSPYFLDGLRSVEPVTAVERLFHGLAFRDGEMLTVSGSDREGVARSIRDGFMDAGYTGIQSESPSELVLFDPSVIEGIRSVSLGEPVIPADVEFTSVDVGGVKVTCPECGLSCEAVWDEHGVHAYVWSYASDRRGHWVWVQATCNGCGRVEVFRTTGGDASGYPREPRDYDRKHETRVREHLSKGAVWVR